MEQRAEIRQCLDAIEFGVVSTLENGAVKSRAMHFAVDDNLNFYLARLNFNQTLYLIPANADTILSHLYGGILISLGYILDKLLLG